MLKALFRKQFMEFAAMLFRNRKNGARRTGAKAVLFIILFALAFLSVAFMFFMMAESLAGSLVSIGMGWLYFALMALIATAFGVFGSVFNTYASLYQAKDNELLLSMPIPPSRILLVRLVSVSLLGLLYESLVWIPTIAVYTLSAGFLPFPFLLQLLTGLFIALIVTALSCFLGWIVALIAVRLKNKSFLTVLIALVFLTGYYILYGSAYRVLASILANAEQVGSGIRVWALPFYHAGKASDGNLLSLLIFAAMAVAAAALTWAILSRSFLHITTANRGTARTVYRERAVKMGNVRSALFKKELKRLTSSANYMLNCCLGTVFLPVAGIAALIYAPKIRELLDSFAAGEGASFAAWLPLLAAGSLCLMGSMNDLTAPSVSLEGKNLWIVKSFPVTAWEALSAKLRLHLTLTLPPLLFAGAALCIVLRLSVPASLLMLATCAAYTVFTALSGLALNLLSPNLSWTNETIPIKSSLPVTVTLLGSWGLTVVLALGAWLLSAVIPPIAILGIFAVLFAVLSVLLLLWMKTRGTKIFAELD